MGAAGRPDAWLLRNYGRLALAVRLGLGFTAVQPVCYLLFFAPRLGRVVDVPGFGGADQWQFFVPGVLLQLAAFQTLFTGFVVISDIEMGVIDRMRVTPVSRVALVLGRMGVATATAFAQALILTLVGVAMGLRAPVGGVAVMLLLVLPVAVGISALSIALALVLGSDDTFPPLIGTVSLPLPLPLLLLSGVLLPMSLAPRWLQVLSAANPLRWVMEAMRAAVVGDFGATVFAGGTLAAMALAVGGVAIAVATVHRPYG